jgi:hypothetical protein
VGPKPDQGSHGSVLLPLTAVDVDDGIDDALKQIVFVMKIALSFAG